MAETKEEMPLPSAVLVGLALIGDMASPNTETAMQTLAFVAAGHHEFELRAAAYQHATGRAPTTKEVLYTAEVDVLYGRVRDRCRSVIQEVFRRVEVKEEHKRALELMQTKARLRDSNKPHDRGTVAELATRLGVSKSEVRRLKAEGKLDEALAALPK